MKWYSIKYKEPIKGFTKDGVYAIYKDCFFMFNDGEIYLGKCHNTFDEDIGYDTLTWFGYGRNGLSELMGTPTHWCPVPKLLYTENSIKELQNSMELYYVIAEKLTLSMDDTNIEHTLETVFKFVKEGDSIKRANKRIIENIRKNANIIIEYECEDDN